MNTPNEAIPADPLGEGEEYGITGEWWGRDDALVEEINILLGLLQDQIELNPSNYDHDDACRLNTEADEIATIGLDLLPRILTTLRNREQVRAEAFGEAKEVAIGQSNYGHIEGNRRAFLIAELIEKRIRALSSKDTPDNG